jgi:hypothetical protein
MEGSQVFRLRFRKNLSTVRDELMRLSPLILEVVKISEFEILENSTPNVPKDQDNSKGIGSNRT